MTRSTQVIRERAWIEVNLANLAANAETVRAAARGARLLPMVKADGYGLGAIRVCQALERGDPWGYGVATVGEGAALRAAGIRRPIVVFTPALAECQPRYREYDLQAVLDDPAVVREWSLPFQLEIDTGMGRSGLRWDSPVLVQCRTPQLQGAFMHFHSAEDNPASVRTQWERFQQAVGTLGARPPLLFAANSAAVWRLEERLDLVRPGIFLYGCRPMSDVPMPLPVAAVRARVVSIRTIRQGESVSYGAEWISRRAARIATVGFGYADGLAREVQQRADVLIRGRRYPVVGRITMDMIMIDATDAGDQVSRGDVVTLVGTEDEQTITWDDWARWAGTNTYEVMSRLGQRVERVYVG